jgi:hypothetical protein
MTRAIDTLGKAVRHAMLVRVHCSRRQSDRYYRSAGLLQLYSAGRDPLSLPFQCDRRSPPAQKVTLLETRFLDPSTTVLKLEGKGRQRQWMPGRLGPVKTLRDAWMNYETLIVSCGRRTSITRSRG